jgi:hypothetical protein
VFDDILPWDYTPDGFIGHIESLSLIQVSQLLPVLAIILVARVKRASFEDELDVLDTVRGYRWRGMLDCGRIQKLKVVVDTAREDPTVSQDLYLHHFLAWMVGCPANENGVVGLGLKILNEVDISHLD